MNPFPRLRPLGEISWRKQQMQSGMDAVARDARVVRLDEKFRWPGGRHVAVVLNVAYEG